MVIILSGPDKTGKSSIAKGIRDHFDAVYLKCSKMPRDRTEFLVERYLNMFKDNPEHMFVCDRFNFVDDQIYEPVMEERPTVFSEEGKCYYKRELNKIPTLVILTDARIEVIQQRYKDMGGDWYVPFDKIQAIRKGYQQVSKSLGLPVRWIDSSDVTIEENIGEAVGYIGSWMRVRRRDYF